MSVQKHYRDAPITLSNLQQQLIDAATDMRTATNEMRELMQECRAREDQRHKAFCDMMTVLSGDGDEYVMAAE